MPVTLNEPNKALVERVQHCFTLAEREHKQFRDHAGEFYALYRNLQDFRQANVDRRDRDVVRSAKREWGEELFIPYAFRTVETIVPRMLAHRPRINPLPEDQEAFGNVDNMRLMLDKQQERIGYELVLQDICKDGLIYGLGVQKCGWETKKRRVRRIREGTAKNFGMWVEDVDGDGRYPEAVIADDPYAEWIDPFDFLWDPYAHSIDTADYLFHRLWRSDAYIAQMVKSGKWRAQENDPDCEWTLEDILSSSARTKFDEVQADRRAAENYGTQRENDRGRHEIWEQHDGEEIVTVVNSEFPVQRGQNIMPDGSKPFQVFRPTKVPGRMVGIGEIEPIRDLQYEINLLRGQRRDAATMALGRGYAFDETAVNADDLVIGPNIAIPVNGSPRDFLFPLPVPDVPASGYSEENAIKGDIETTSGISDSVTGGEGGGTSATATGAQLVQQAAGLRIQNKTARFGREIIIPAGAAWISLNQVRILKPRPVRVPNDTPGVNEPAWSIVQLGPNELRGRMAVELDDGSTMAKNVPQMRQDAQAFQSLMGNPLFRPEFIAQRILQNLGVENTKAAIVPPEPQIPASVVEEFLGLAGIPPEALVAFMDQKQAQEQDPNAQAPEEQPA